MTDLSNWNVIVVDDEPDNIGVVKLVLEFHDSKVRIAESGEACLKLLNAEMPSLLLVDIQMPEMSGFELLAHIKAEDRWHHIPVIAVTAHAMRGDHERILAAGFDGYIPKPVNVMTIVDDVQKILQAREG